MFLHPRPIFTGSSEKGTYLPMYNWCAVGWCSLPLTSTSSTYTYMSPYSTFSFGGVCLTHCTAQLLQMNVYTSRQLLVVYNDCIHVNVVDCAYVCAYSTEYYTHIYCSTAPSGVPYWLEHSCHLKEKHHTTVSVIFHHHNSKFNAWWKKWQFLHVAGGPQRRIIFLCRLPCI